MCCEVSRPAAIGTDAVSQGAESVLLEAAIPLPDRARRDAALRCDVPGKIIQGEKCPQPKTAWNKHKALTTGSRRETELQHRHDHFQPIRGSPARLFARWLAQPNLFQRVQRPPPVDRRFLPGAGWMTTQPSGALAKSGSDFCSTNNCSRKSCALRFS